jgi:iron complex outermembrane receptor protein
LKELSFSAAIRYEDFSDVGDTGIKPRFSMRWQPFETKFVIKGSYAEGFIAPGFTDLYQLPGQDFIEVYNPYTSLREQPEDAVLTIGNPNLQPTEAKTWTLGGTYEPDFLKGFSIGVSYYNIEQEGVPFQSAQYIVNQWYAWNPLNPRDPTNPFGPTAGRSPANPLGAQVELNSADEISQIRNIGSINTGTRFTDGLDFTAAQRFETDFGTFTLAGQATWIMNYEQEDFPGSGPTDYLGRYWGPGSQFQDTSFPEWRANIALTYEYKRWTAAVAWNYVCTYEEDITQQNFAAADSVAREVSDFSSFDIRVGFKIPKVEADLMVGINNIFDEQPPEVQSSFENAYDRAVGDIRGRMLFVSLNKEF